MSKREKIINERACRICLDSKCINTVTLDSQNGWLQMFEFCFGISLSMQDASKILCQKCAYNVKKYSLFKKLCHESEKVWKSLSKVHYDQECFIEKIEPNTVVKNEIAFEENTKTVNESNYAYVEQFSSDFINFADNMDDDVMAIKIKSLKSEICTNEVSIKNINSDESNTSFILKVPYDQKRSSRKVKNPNTCKRCYRNYGSKLWYLKHLKLCKSRKMKQINPNQEHNSGKKINLEEANKLLNSCKNMENQQKNVNFCGVCRFSSNNIDDVTKHLDGHWTNNDLQCMMCEYVAKDQAAIAAHRYDHYDTKTTTFLCHICQKKTKSQLTLQFHYRKAHLNKTGGLCSQPQCDKVYDSWKLWKRHEKMHNHPGYICDICGQKYKHRHLIAEHLINHISPPTHVCDLCGKTFLRLRNLRVHIGNVHVESEPLKCSHCNRMFKNQNYLKSHQKMLTMEKVWKCEFCPMEYPMLSSLNSHLKSHSEERPHCCHICGSRYKAKSQLAIHMRNHTGDRPFKCTVCAKAFKSGAVLKTHGMVHTGILPYKCLHCEKMFRCKKRMMKHCTLRHKTMAITEKNY